MEKESWRQEDEAKLRETELTLDELTKRKRRHDIALALETFERHRVAHVAIESWLTPIETPLAEKPDPATDIIEASRKAVEKALMQWLHVAGAGSPEAAADLVARHLGVALPSAMTSMGEVIGHLLAAAFGPRPRQAA